MSMTRAMVVEIAVAAICQVACVGVMSAEAQVQLNTCRLDTITPVEARLLLDDPSLLDSLRQAFAMRAWQIRSGLGSQVVLPGTAGPVAEDTRARLTTGRLDSTDVARALAIVMRGPRAGFSSDDATMAADLYDSWNLPFGPAAALLEGAAEPLTAKRWAVRALRRYWQLGRYQQLATSVICDMAARAGALTRGNPDTTGAVWAILSYEEFSLLDQLSRSMLSDSAGTRLMIVTANSLPRENPVSRFLASLVSP